MFAGKVRESGLRGAFSAAFGRNIKVNILGNLALERNRETI
jgi:hypothetical protein